MILGRASFPSPPSTRRLSTLTLSATTGRLQVLTSAENSSLPHRFPTHKHEGLVVTVLHQHAQVASAHAPAGDAQILENVLMYRPCLPCLPLPSPQLLHLSEQLPPKRMHSSKNASPPHPYAPIPASLLSTRRQGRCPALSGTQRQPA